jgi:hypothetical protein
VLPIRTKERIETELPTWQKSKIDSADPNVAIPYTERLDPILINDRKLNEDPKFMKSSAETLDPKRTMP